MCVFLGYRILSEKLNKDVWISVWLSRAFAYDHLERFQGEEISYFFTTQREIFLKSYQIKPKSECIYHFLIDLEPNGRPFGSRSIGKW